MKCNWATRALSYCIVLMRIMLLEVIVREMRAVSHGQCGQ